MTIVYKDRKFVELAKPVTYSKYKWMSCKDQSETDCVDKVSAMSKDSINEIFDQAEEGFVISNSYAD